MNIIGIMGPKLVTLLTILIPSIDTKDKVVLVLIWFITDGQENASHRFSSDEVKKMIEHQKAEYGWEFLFIGANIDAVETAVRFGIGRNHAVNYTADSEGTQLLYETLSTPIFAMRADKEISDDCSSHNIREDKITEALVEIINRHIESIIEIEKMLKYIEKLPKQEREAQLIDRQIEKLRAELERNNNYKRLTFEKYTDGIIDEKMFLEYSEIYSKKCDDLEAAIEKHQADLDKVVSGKSSDNEWIIFFKQYRKIKALNRVFLVMLIDHIDVYEDSRFTVVFKYQDQYNIAKNYISEKLSKEE